MPAKGHVSGQEALGKLRVAYKGRLVDGFALLVCKEEAVFRRLQLHLPHLALLQHGNKRAVIGILDLAARHHRHCQKIEEQQSQKNNNLIVDNRLFGLLYLVHSIPLIRAPSVMFLNILRFFGMGKREDSELSIRAEQEAVSW